MSGRAEGRILTVAEAGRGRMLALARRIVVHAAPGTGALDLSALAGARGVDARVECRDGAVLAGRSAGHALELLFLSALLEETLPPHFAVGDVEDDLGFLVGGAAAAMKSEAAREVAEAAGLSGVPFLYPPIATPIPPVDRLRPIRVPDAPTSLSILAPSAYARIKAAHDAARRMSSHMTTALSSGLPVPGPFMVLLPSEGRPEEDDVIVGAGGRVVYRTRIPSGDVAQAESIRRGALSTSFDVASLPIQDP